MATRKARAGASKAGKPAGGRRTRSLLAGLSSDWYWEQDAAFRFVRVDVHSRAPGEQELASLNLGRRPWETGVSVEGGWDAHRARLKARASFREVLMWRDFEDGSRRYISVTGEPVFDARGRFSGYRGTGRDITGQKRGEQLLRLQHTVTRRLAEAAGPVEGAREALRAICESEGWDCGELWRADETGAALRRFADWVLPGAEARYATIAADYVFHRGEGLVGSAWQSGKPLWVPDASQDARVARKSRAGQHGVHAVLLCPVHSGGQVSGVLDFMCRKIRPPDDALLDAITAVATQLGLFLQRAEAEARLRGSEERFRRTFELAGSGLAHVGMDGRFLRVNRRLCEMFGYGEAELVGRSLKELSHPEDRDLTDSARARLHRGETDLARFEKRYLRKDGSTLWAHTSVALERDAAGTPLYEIAVMDDIGARKDGESALRESEQRFRHTFELARVGVAHIGPDRRFLRVNRRFCEILGYPEGELVGRTGRDLSHPDDLDVMNAQRPRLYAGEIDEVRGEKRYLRKDGLVVWVAYALAIQRDAAGNPQYEIAVYEDISDRKRAEAALRDSEARFRSLTELSSDWYWELDAEYRFTRLEGPKVAGGDRALRERLIGTRRWDSGLEIEGGWEAHRALLDARKPFSDALMWRRMSDGGLRYVSVSGEPIFAPDGSFAGYRGVGRDITQEKSSEKLLRLEHQVVRSLAEAESEAEGLKGVLRAICEEERWSCGRFFRLDEARDEMRFECAWGIDDPGIAAFLAASREMRLGRGQGLIGHAWTQGEAVWASDTAKDPRSLGQGLRFAGLHGAFVFPVISAGRTLGVCSFISNQVREPDERLLDATRVLGAQLGQFLERKAAESALRRSEARFRALTEMSSDFFWETDPEHRFTGVVHGPSYAGKMGQMAGKRAWEIPSTHPDEAGWAGLRAKVDAHLPFREFEFGRPWPDGTVRYFSVSGDPYFAPEGAFLGYRGIGREITDLVLARERIASLAYHDSLTGLANRASLAPALEQAIERTRRRGSRLAGLFLDLDGFKQINDLYGHDAGDRLLVEAAQRLRAALRSSDPLARLGGDEFFVVLEDLQSNAPAERVAQKLLAALLQPYDVGAGRRAQVSASIGISVFPDDAGDAATLVKHADTAMYGAKQAGKNAYRFFIAGAAANDSPAASEENTL